jgi:hypothetical protein
VNAAGGLEKDERRGHGSNSHDPAREIAGLAGREAEEEETVGRQPRQGKRREHGRRPGRGVDRQARTDRGPNEIEPGVGDHRRSSLGGIGDRAARGERLEQGNEGAGAGVIVQGNDPPAAERDRVDLHQMAQAARVLGGKDIGRGEHVEGVQRDVARSTDRRGQDVKPGREPARTRPLEARRRQRGWNAVGVRHRGRGPRITVGSGDEIAPGVNRPVARGRPRVIRSGAGMGGVGNDRAGGGRLGPGRPLGTFTLAAGAHRFRVGSIVEIGAMMAVSLGRRKLGALLAGSVATMLLGPIGCGPAAGPVAGRGPLIVPGAAVPVALLVPSGSGQAGDELLARALENAARLAMADLGPGTIDLRVLSTAGTPEGAATAAAAAADAGAAIILGPVYAQEANAAGAAVAARGVTVLSFSNNPDVAGGNVVVLGQGFAGTAARLAGHAARSGVRVIGVLHDRTPDGSAGAEAIEAAARRAGLSVAGVKSYEFSQSGVMTEVPVIAAEFRSAGVEAVFVTADTAGALPLASQMLRDSGLTPAPARLIGIKRWDIPAGTTALPGLQGGWFAAPDPELARAFAARFEAANGEPPHPIAALAYDGIAAIGALARTGRPEAMQRASLGQAAGFAGVGGVFRILPDGTTERGMAVMEVRDREAVVVDPAPRSFTGAGI